MTMKIVIISPFLFRLNRGIERFTYSISNNLLIHLKCQITIYTWSGIHKNMFGSWDRRIQFRILPPIKYYESFLAGIFYNIWLKIDKPDIVLLNFIYQGESFIRNRYRFVYVLHSPASQIPQRYEFLKKKLKSKFHKMFFIAVSNIVKKESLKYINKSPIKVIYNGVDLNIFKPNRKNLFNSNKNGINIITTSALERRKGIQYMIDAIRIWPYNIPIKYHIYGSGSYESELKTKISQYQLSNIVKIYHPVSMLNELLPQYDLCCLLSKGEAFGLSILEAMACGLPVIVSRKAPFDEFVNESFGFMIDPANTIDLCHKIHELCEPKLRIKMSKQARKESKKFSWEKTSIKYAGFFNSINIKPL